ncbi:MAG: hypothetical protein WA555_06565 [Candidatus Sulfotelmatobacter sp.]
MTLFSIAFLILALLLLVSGIAIVFVYFPRWLMHRRRLTPREKLIAWFALIGLVIPIVFIGRYAVTRTEFVTEAMFVWPAALILTDLTGRPSNFAIVANLSLAVVANVGLYGWLGAFVAWVRKKSNSKT